MVYIDPLKQQNGYRDSGPAAGFKNGAGHIYTCFNTQKKRGQTLA